MGESATKMTVQQTSLEIFLDTIEYHPRDHSRHKTLFSLGFTHTLAPRDAFGVPFKILYLLTYSSTLLDVFHCEEFPLWSSFLSKHLFHFSFDLDFFFVVVVMLLLLLIPIHSLAHHGPHPVHFHSHWDFCCSTRAPISHTIISLSIYVRCGLLNLHDLRGLTLDISLLTLPSQ